MAGPGYLRGGQWRFCLAMCVLGLGYRLDALGMWWNSLRPGRWMVELGFAGEGARRGGI